MSSFGNKTFGLREVKVKRGATVATLPVAMTFTLASAARVSRQTAAIRRRFT